MHSWVVDADYPAGHLVEMSPEERAQLERDQAAGAVIAAAQAAVEASEAERCEDLRLAREELASRAIFAALSPRERSVIDLLLESA
jgi:hypothetical protein